MNPNERSQERKSQSNTLKCGSLLSRWTHEKFCQSRKIAFTKKEVPTNHNSIEFK